MKSDVVPDYGWTDALPKPSQSYLSPIRSLLSEVGAKKILDLGCGNGAMANWLQSCGFDVTGCDVDSKGIELAMSQGTGAVFQNVGIYDIPDSLRGRDFDAVYSTEVIEHLFFPSALPRFARAVLKPNKYLIITTPYHGYLKNLLISISGKWDSHHTSLWDGGHIKFWSKTTLSKLLQDNGFEITGFVGAGRVYALWKSMIVVARAV